MSRELLKRATVVLREVWDNDDCYCAPSVIELQKEIIAYLAQPEPVAWMVENHPEELDTFVNFTPNFNSHFEKLGCKITPLYTTPPDQSARIAELEKDNNLTHENLAWYMAKYYEHLKIIEVLRDILIRYRNVSPIGHQPHMIAHEVDNALAAHGIVGVNNE